MSERKRAQVVQQCKAVAHMARVLAEVHQDYVRLYEDPDFNPTDGVVDIVGERTAKLMEDLGDALNGMDATDAEADAWVNPVLVEAQRMFPTKAQHGGPMRENTSSLVSQVKDGE